MSLRIWRCEKAGCNSTTVNPESAAAHGWQMPDAKDRLRLDRDPHHVAGAILCPLCVQRARRVVLL